MHGVSRKSTFWNSDETLNEYEEWHEKYNLSMRKKEPICLDDLKWTATALLLIPDHYFLWNRRKRVWRDCILSEKSEGLGIEGDEGKKALLKDELKLIVKCIRERPKSYDVWYHRVWLLKTVPSEWVDWKHELSLIEMMLDLDSRNFHCWDYRRFIVSKISLSSEEEFQFTTKKIKQNFSNYSAWHYRSELLRRKMALEKSQSELENILDQEFELIQNAVYTEPADQSAWLYHKWLSEKGISLLESTETRAKFLERELSRVCELLEEEPNAKWAILMKYHLLGDKGTEEERKALLSKLEKVDPCRKTYYQSLFSKTSTQGFDFSEGATSFI